MDLLRQRREEQNRKEGVSYVVTAECLLVYVDIETNGFSKNAEILQIGAKCAGVNGAEFSVHAYPLREISSRVREVTGLEMIGGQLLLHGKPVPATNQKTMAQNFVTFLKNTGKPMVLVGHNSLRFDFPRIYKLLGEYNLLSEFTSIVCGFTDTLQVFKSNDVIRNEPSFKQSNLAAKYLPNWSAEGAHEALQDCVTLEAICAVLKCDDKLLSSCVITAEFVKKQIRLETKNSVEPGLLPLRNVLSNAVIKRLAENGLSLEVLRENYRNGQGEAIKVLLAEDDGAGKPKVTASKKIIKKLIDFLQSSEETASN